MSQPLADRQAQLDAVIKTAQYLAGLGAERDIWAELSKVAIHFLGADLVAFIARRADGRLVVHHCAATGAGSCASLPETAEGIIRQVLDSGFLATETLMLEEECTVAFLPLDQGTPSAAVMAIGHRTGEPLSRETLNLYLAVAGLFKSTLSRLASQHRFLVTADNVPEMLFQLVHYPDGKMEFTYASGGSRSALGLAPDELLADLNRFSSRLVDGDRNEFESIAASDSGRLNRVLRWEDKAGRERHILVNAMPTRQEDGSIVWDGAIQDVTERERLEEERKQYLMRLERSMEETVEAMASTIEMRDPYTAGHQRRVADLAMRIAKELGLSDEEVHGINVAASIHDIGKIHVPSDILSFPGKLGTIEFELVKTHPQIGYEILKVVDFPWPVADMVLQHHERLDGSGYPRGLKGEEIILGARIISVADVVESIATFRPYRPALGPEEALEDITRNRGVLYDPRVVDACVRLFREQGYQFTAS
jgi:PAS domain S-box-containing protein